MGLLDEVLSGARTTDRDRQQAQAAMLAQLGIGLLSSRNWQQGMAMGAQNGIAAYQNALAAGPQSRI